MQLCDVDVDAVPVSPMSSITFVNKWLVYR